jgi:hypothetical protein
MEEDDGGIRAGFGRTEQIAVEQGGRGVVLAVERGELHFFLRNRAVGRHPGDKQRDKGEDRPHDRAMVADPLGAV